MSLAVAPEFPNLAFHERDEDFSVNIHDLYGIGIRTPWPLANIPRRANAEWDVELINGAAGIFVRAAARIPAARRGRWHQSARLPDGSVFCRWLGMFEFIVRPGARRIEVRCFPNATDESLQAYLLTQALSFSMIELGCEPLHATAVQTEWGAIAFAGSSGFGKSTLGALMVAAGCPLVTDDMLILNPRGGEFIARQGQPRLKLYRHVADSIFSDRYRGVPMNPVTQKLIIPVMPGQFASGPEPLRAIYVIQEPAGKRHAALPRIERLSAGEAFPIIIGATLNNWITDPGRLQRQFRFATELARTVPVKRLVYPRDKSQMFDLRDAVLDDLSSCA